MATEPLLTFEQILPILPHRPPFLFVDRVLSVQPFKTIIAERTLRPEEPQFQGHFPGRAIMPGVLISEALAQACGLLLALSEKLSGAPEPAKPKMYFLAAVNFKFQRPVAPGETLTLTGRYDAKMGTLFRFSAEALVQDQPVASGSLMLAFVSNG